MQNGLFFRGVSQVTVDPKGRLGIPSRYRSPLLESCGGRLIATADRDGCLLIYPHERWEEVERQLYRLPSLDNSARFIQRLTLGYATECELDGQGRILLSSPLREFARLDKHALLFGQGERFELWDRQQWEHQRTLRMSEASEDGNVNEVLEGVRL